MPSDQGPSFVIFPKAFDAGLVFCSFDGISSGRITSFRLSNCIVISSFFNKGVKLYFSNETKYSILFWHKEAWCSYKIDVWLASTISSKYRMILSSLANYMMCFLSVIHFSWGWLLTLWCCQCLALIVLPASSRCFGSSNLMITFLSNPSWAPDKSELGNECFFSWSSFSMECFFITSLIDMLFLSSNSGFPII